MVAQPVFIERKIMSAIEDLKKHLEKCGAIRYGDFIGKSGCRYHIETDVRRAFFSYGNAMMTSNLIYLVLKETGISNTPFIGVPETGSLMAFFLNACLYNDVKTDFQFNMLRSQPKEYQESTHSVFTVLPMEASDKEYTIVEDDVVTGNTLINYIKVATEAGLRIKNAFAVFGRKNTEVISQKCMEFGVNYTELINIKE